jgi:DNA integrity scanning protein DisA with diadenylate cyclase activity
MIAAFILFILASILNLEGIKWIFKNVSHVAMLGLIVIFQPEIRKTFEKVASLAVAKKNINTDDSNQIVADSLWSLAAQKCGAIIVLPGKEQILDKISGGNTLYALPSIPLIKSIFDPNSPGHDGAVILVANLLTHFGVRLPMSKSSRLPEDFGTRHHAAMGMAEETDALVLLVSEERGHVSSFKNGEMIRLGSPEEIIDAVEKHFSKLGINPLAQITSINPRTVLQVACSLLVAIIFWSTMILGQKQIVERTLNIPIEYTSPKEGLVLTGNKVLELVIHAAGAKSAMNDFALSAPNALIDLSPADLQLTLAAIVQQTVPIIPQFIGQLPTGLQIKKVQIFPEALQVYAPPIRQGNKSLSVSTTPIYLTSINADSRILCKTIAPPSFQPVEKRWPDVEVIITLE